MLPNDSDSVAFPSMTQIETLVAALADLMHTDAERLGVEMRSIGLLPPLDAATPTQDENSECEPMACGVRIEDARTLTSSDLLTVTDKASQSSFYAIPNDTHDGPSATALFFFLPDPRD